MKTFRQAQQETLWKSLGNLQTLSTLLEYIRYIIIRLESSDERGPSEYGSIAETHTTVPATGSIYYEAFIQQSDVLGWDNFLRGRISQLWGESFLQASMARQ
jgi:hypothetical protein